MIENHVHEEFGNAGRKRDWAKGGWKVTGLPGLCMRIMVAGFQQKERCEKTRTS